MLKIEPELSPELLFELWRLRGRTKTYPSDWPRELLTPIYIKDEVHVPPNQRPVFMLSCMRKVIEASLAEKVAKLLEISSRQFGFQNFLSPTVTLLDVDALLKSGTNKIATFDLAKGYDSVNRRTLIEDFEKTLDDRLTKMLNTCL